jgi:hypothetical protein
MWTVLENSREFFLPSDAVPVAKRLQDDEELPAPAVLTGQDLLSTAGSGHSISSLCSFSSLFDDRPSHLASFLYLFL